MKKKLLSLFAMMMAMTMCVGFTSCTDGDDEGEGKMDVTIANLVGTWQLMSAEEYDENGSLEGSWKFSGSYSDETFIEYIEDYEYDCLHFDADQTVTKYEYDYVEEEWGFVESYSYTLNGNTVTFNTGENDTKDVKTVTKLTESELDLVYSYSDGCRVVKTYKKVSDSVIADAK